MHMENSILNLSLFTSDSANWVKVDGVLVKPGVAVITNIDDSDKPSFSEVVNIFPSAASVIWIGLRELLVVDFHSHFHSWVVKRTEIVSLKMFKELASMQVLPVRPARFDADLLLYITLKYSP